MSSSPSKPQKVAVVTGAASGIGLATSAALIAEGAQVILTDVNAEALHAAVKSLGSSAHALVHDVGSIESWQRLEQLISSQFGYLDILVNNAGVSLSGTIEELTLPDLHRAGRVNFDGVVLGCQMALRLMTSAERGGCIVNIGSSGGVKVTPFVTGYGAMKAAVIYLSQAVALHCAQTMRKIRCNVVNPGIIETPIYNELYDRMGGRDAVREMLRKIAPGEMIGEVADIAAMVTFLASDAGRYINGASLNVDGALSIS